MHTRFHWAAVIEVKTETAHCNGLAAALVLAGIDATVKCLHYSLGKVTVPEIAPPSGTNPMTGLAYPATYQHMYTITGLEPNTKYYYQVGDATNGVYGTGSFLNQRSAYNAGRPLDQRAAPRSRHR